MIPTNRLKKNTISIMQVYATIFENERKNGFFCAMDNTKENLHMKIGDRYLTLEKGKNKRMCVSAVVLTCTKSNHTIA